MISQCPVDSSSETTSLKLHSKPCIAELIAAAIYHSCVQAMHFWAHCSSTLLLRFNHIRLHRFIKSCIGKTCLLLCTIRTLQVWAASDLSFCWEECYIIDHFSYISKSKSYVSVALLLCFVICCMSVMFLLHFFYVPVLPLLAGTRRGCHPDAWWGEGEIWPIWHIQRVRVPAAASHNQ